MGRMVSLQNIIHAYQREIEYKCDIRNSGS